MSETKKYSYLIKNIGILTLSSFATKLLSFFLLPLYTDILSTEEYGTYDFINTTVGLLTPILTLCIGDAVMRFELSKNHNNSEVLAIGIKYFLLSNSIVLFLVLINYFCGLVPVINSYAGFFVLMYMSQTLQTIIPSYVRGIEKISSLSFSSALAITITMCLNILFLVFFRWGIKGFFLANIIGSFSECIYLIIRLKVFDGLHIVFSRSKTEKEMTDYSKPLVFTNVAWWVNGVSDRYVVTYFCGIDTNGIYSVASKIPTILNVIHTIFSQAWGISAVKEIDTKNNVEFFSNIYHMYNCALVLLCSLIIAGDKILSRILFSGDFYQAWKYVPWLTIAVIFLALSAYFGGVFASAKDTRIYARSTLIGAAVNLVLNFLLVPFIGAIGAAYATTISYFVVWFLRYKKALQYVPIEVNIFRDIITYAILISQALIMNFYDGVVLYILEALMVFVIVCLYYKDELYLLRFALKMIGKKND